MGEEVEYLSDVEFYAAVHRVLDDVAALAKCAELPVEWFDLLSMEEYQIILGCIKEYSWYRP